MRVFDQDAIWAPLIEGISDAGLETVPGNPLPPLMPQEQVLAVTTLPSCSWYC